MAETTTHTVKMAKASNADLEMAMDLTGMLETLSEHGYFPNDGEDRDRYFNEDDPEHCQQAIALLFAKFRQGSLFRVVYGMSVLCDPRNRVIDPDADTLDHPPETKTNAVSAARYAHIRSLEDRELAAALVAHAEETMDAAVDKSMQASIRSQEMIEPV